MLTNEQAEQIKKQIIQQIGSTFPEDKKESAKEQISLMNSEQLEEFLKQNNLMKKPVSENTCVFCSIIFGDAQSYKIEESDNAVAVLEINPISKGHTLVIPKEHVSKEKISKSVFSFAEKLKKKLKTKLHAKNILISPSEMFGHGTINLIPVYQNENINSPRMSAKTEELQELQKVLKEIPKKKISKTPNMKKLKEKLWLPKRIP